MGYHTPIIDYPKMQILRGFAGNSADNLSRVAPIAAGQQIRNGQLVMLDSSGNATLADPARIGTDGDDPQPQVFLSMHDYTDGDAKEAGAQLLDTKGMYEVLTPWFDETKTYKEGTRLTVGASGKIKPVETPANEPVIGIATGEKNGSCVLDMTGQISEAQNMDMLRFQTRYGA